MILDGADAVEFWKNEEDVTFTKEQLESIKMQGASTRNIDFDFLWA